MAIENKPRIGIIGAGAAGLTCAWLLEQDYNVTLLEREPRLGGHAYTEYVQVNGTTVPVDTGAEFFCDALFPDFNRLLAILDVPVRKYPLTYTFYNRKAGETIVMPPLNADSVSWQTLKPKELLYLMELKHFLDRGVNIVAQKDTVTSLEEYVETLTLTPAFKSNFLYPFLAAGWGVTPQDMKAFIAYDILAWVLSTQPKGLKIPEWNEIIGGMSAYVKALEKQLQRATVTINAAITSINHTNNTYLITLADNTQITVDYLIIATNASQASILLADIKESQDLKNILQTIKYFPTTIAVHGDTRLMPENQKDWGVANVSYDGVNCALTICKTHMKQIPVFRSWITYPVDWPTSNPLPEPLYAVKHFYHATANKEYFEVQKKIPAFQGKNNIWIAGNYTHDIDSHNSAVKSAMLIAQKLAPQSERLLKLMNK